MILIVENLKIDKNDSRWQFLNKKPLNLVETLEIKTIDNWQSSYPETKTFHFIFCPNSNNIFRFKM